MAQSRDGSSRFSRKVYRVTLSPEGNQKLFPRRPLDGWVQRIEDGLIVVLEPDGREYAYHPDFLEPA